MKKKIGLVFMIVFVVIGFVILLGTAGASDLNRISFDEMTKRCLIGIMFFVFGFLSMKIGGLDSGIY